MSDTSDKRAQDAAARSLATASNSVVFSADTPQGADLMRRYADRLDNLLDDRDEVGEEIKELKKEMKGNGVNTSFVTKATMARRKRAKKETAEFELIKQELALYMIAICGDDSAQP